MSEVHYLVMEIQDRNTNGSATDTAPPATKYCPPGPMPQRFNLNAIPGPETTEITRQ